MPFVTFHNLAREWRCRWSEDSDNASLMAAQTKLNEVLDELSCLDGVISIQRIVCGACHEFKVITKLTEKAFKDWEEAAFVPEDRFLEALRSVTGVTGVEAQTYTLEDVKLSKREVRKLHEYKERDEKLSHDPVELKHKIVKQEGGKRGVEIESAADVGALHFFCTSVSEPDGDVNLLEESVHAMNAKSDLADLERKGGSDHIGKMVFSAGRDQLAIVVYVPKHRREEVNGEEWLQAVIGTYSGATIVKQHDGGICAATIPADADKDIVPVRLRVPLIRAANEFLRARGLFPQETPEGEEDVVYGDDDFPASA
mmetsp:Transcript_31967/g.92409  ORF Transcript_31967/g.92409 Transcript_31967/m.92409 type:complete len:313 (+) Transcript_31967:92-1030(+)